MKKPLLLVCIILWFSILVACSNNEPTPDSLSDEHKIETIVAGTLSAIPSLTPIPTGTPVPTSIPTNTPDVNQWVWHSIDLYAIKIQLPYGWSINEAKRWLEPVGLGYPTPEHDCAEYSVTSPDGTANVFLKPECVFFGAGPAECPDNVVLMSRDSNTIVRYDNLDVEETIGRFYTNEKSAYIYSTVGYPVWEGKEIASCYEPTSVVVKKEQSVNFVYVEFKFTGNEADLDQTLETADKIVLSMSKP